MIMKANKQIGFIYKNEESIDKILKDGEVVFERGFLREKTSTTLPITFGGVGKDLKDYKVYGNTYQNSTSGKNLLDDKNITSRRNCTVNNGVITTTPLARGNLVYVNINDIPLKAGDELYTTFKVRLKSGNASMISYGGRLYDGITYATNTNVTPSTVSDEFVIYSIKQTTTTDIIANQMVFQAENAAGVSDAVYEIKDIIVSTNPIDTYEEYTGGQPSPNPDYPQEMVSVGKNKTGLPVEYTQVDYIESSGTQYIDTGYKLNGNSEIYTDYMLTSVSPNEIGMIFGARENNDKRGFMFGDASSNNSFPVAYYGEGNTSSSIAKAISTNSENNKMYNLTVKDGKFNISELGTISFTKSTFSLTNSMYIFCGNQNSSPSYKVKARIYNFNIYENDTLIRNFIPCYRNSDNEVGLYDLVNNIFYTNQGTGVFTYGSEIEKGGYKIPVNVNNVITNIYLDEPLRKIDGYSDYIDFINGKVVRNIGEIILNGTENWKLADIYNNISQFDYSNVLIKKFTTKDNIALFANYFGTTNQWSQSWLKDNIALHRIINNKIRIQSSNFTTLEDFKTWLSTHNTIVDYVLETPTIEDIELPNIPTVDENNTLNIETEITPSQVYIKYKSNT